MTADRYQANIITKSPTTPTGPLETGSAPGVWSVEEANEFTKAGVWPTAGNVVTDVTDVFSNYLYTGNGSTQTITTGLDLSTDGGLVWIKSRSTRDHVWFDTERGNSAIESNTTDAESADRGFTGFTTTGFSLNDPVNGDTNNSSGAFTSWNFKKAPRFFDCVTYTGDGTTSRAISHNLGCLPGFIVIKAYSNIGGQNGGWACFHNNGSSDLTTAITAINLNRSDSNQLGTTVDMSSHITTTTFNPYEIRDTGYQRQNASGVNYVAYIFAHNDNDGGFGPDQDQDIIKCGMIDNSSGAEVDLGFEPQFVLFKRSDATSDWAVNDTMRGYGPGTWKLLRGNTT